MAIRQHSARNAIRARERTFYIASGPVCLEMSVVRGNIASTSDNDVFGTFITDC